MPFAKPDEASGRIRPEIEAALDDCLSNGDYILRHQLGDFEKHLAEMGGLLIWKEKAIHLLKKTGVASVPDCAFFSSPLERSYVRFCYAKEDAELQDACDRLLRT